MVVFRSEFSEKNIKDFLRKRNNGKLEIIKKEIRQIQKK
jgi:hypothetical protein